MDHWVLWIIIAVVLAVGEVLTLSFFLAPFAGGALAAALADVIGAGAALEVATFIVVSGLTLGLVRPIARNHRRTPPQIRTGTAALIGRPATVVERVANREGAGSVKIDGEVWTARSYDDDRVIEVNEQVEVIEIRGAIAVVSG